MCYNEGHVLKHSQDNNMLDHMLTKYVIMLAGCADHLEPGELHLGATEKTKNAITFTNKAKFFLNC